MKDQLFDTLTVWPATVSTVTRGIEFRGAQMGASGLVTLSVVVFFMLIATPG